MQRQRSLRAEARNAIDNCPGWKLRAAAKRISAYFDARLSAADLSFSQFGLMALVASAEDDTIGALAHEARLDQSTMSRNLEALARDGLVEIAAVEADRRRRAVWLTEKGVRRLEAALPLWRAAGARLSGVLDVALARRISDEALGADLGPAPGRPRAASGPA